MTKTERRTLALQKAIDVAQERSRRNWNAIVRDEEDQVRRENAEANAEAEVLRGAFRVVS